MIVNSSLWHEPDYVVKVFITMMALKDSDHIVRLNAFQLADMAKKTEVEVLDALKVLSSPDTKRKEPQEFEGRRIKAVEEGWLILNGEKYRDMLSIEMTRARNRRSAEAFRQRQKDLKKYPKPGKPLPGEMAHKKHVESGGDLNTDAFYPAAPGPNY